MADREKLSDRVIGLVHEKTQRGPAGLELTLHKLFRIQGGAALDFGGSEYRAAESQPMSPQKAPDEKYGWWQLEPGAYKLHFNESLKLQEGERAILTPHPRLLEAGASHASVIFGPDEPMFVLLQVLHGGLLLKENCRVSRLNIL